MNIDLAKWIGNLSYLDIAVAIAALLSLCISLYELVSRKLEEKTKISAAVDYDAGFDLFHSCQKNNEILCCVPCLFMNDADSDISITKIEFVLKDRTVIKCSQREKTFFTYLNSASYGPVAKSIRFPINLARMQGTYGVLCFEISQNNKHSEITNVIFHTNRKTICNRVFAKDMSLAVSKLINEVDKQNNHEHNSCENKKTKSN